MVHTDHTAPQSIEVLWQEDTRILTLEGEPVLEYHVSWPELRGTGRSGTKINRYYRRLIKSWRQRWEREVYWKACLNLATLRANSHPFVSWKGSLRGEVTLFTEHLLSIRMTGQEIRGNRPPNQVRWGDVWDIQEGAPYPIHALYCSCHRWKQKLISQLKKLAADQQASASRFLLPGWEHGLQTFFPKEDYCLTAQGIEIAYPQGSISPMAEGTPVFQLPLSCASETQKIPPKK